MKNLDFIQEMNLSKEELDTFERYIDRIEKVAKNPVEFQNSISRGSDVMFTPEAALALAVVKFAYDLYKDYQKSWLPVYEFRNVEFESQVRNFIQEINRLESQLNTDAAGLDTYARLRKSVIDAKRNVQNRGGKQV